jgi:hypothetical protein
MDEETKPKRAAKAWYKLATFHGVPEGSYDEIAAKNRVTWNRWMASRDVRSASVRTARCHPSALS